jgi:hypothetical protein
VFSPSLTSNTSYTPGIDRKDCKGLPVIQNPVDYRQKSTFIVGGRGFDWTENCSPTSARSITAHVQLQRTFNYSSVSLKMESLDWTAMVSHLVVFAFAYFWLSEPVDLIFYVHTIMRRCEIASQ